MIKVLNDAHVLLQVRKHNHHNNSTYTACCIQCNMVSHDL